MRPGGTATFFLALLLAVAVIYAGRGMMKDQVPGWRDAPSGDAFGALGGQNAGSVRSSGGGAAPSVSGPSFVSAPEKANFRVEMLEACSAKFGVDPSRLRNSYLRIPSVTRALYTRREPQCRGTPSGALSDANCASIANCLKNVVAAERLLADDPGGADDAYELREDARTAGEAFKFLTGREVEYTDHQDSDISASWERLTENQGAARFNPNDQETRALAASINDSLRYGKLTQAELVHEAVAVTGGNLTMGMGSLANIFFNDRALVSRITGMKPAAGKNYYRFTGMYIGLHDMGMIQELGSVAGYANIASNPVVYGAKHLALDLWESTKYGLERFGLKEKSGARLSDFSATRKAVSREGNGNYADKLPEYTKGLTAGMMIRNRISPIDGQPAGMTD